MKIGKEISKSNFVYIQQYTCSRHSFVPWSGTGYTLLKLNDLLCGSTVCYFYQFCTGSQCGNFINIWKLVMQYASPELEEIVSKAPRNAHYRSKTIQEQIIAVLKIYIQQKIVSEIKKTGHFSVLADEATDISNKEQMALILRHLTVSHTIKEDFLSFIKCEKGTSGEVLAGEIKDEVSKLGKRKISL